MRRNPPVLYLRRLSITLPLDGTAEEKPRLPLRAGHDAHIGELVVGVLGPVPSPQRLDQADELAPPLEAGAVERPGD